MVRGWLLVVVVGFAIAGCGDDLGSDASGVTDGGSGSGPDVTSSDQPEDGESQPDGGSPDDTDGSPDDIDGSPSDADGSPDDADGSPGDAVADVVEQHWFNEVDQFGRPRVRWTGIVENLGSQPVEVGVEIEALGADGEALGSNSSQFPWLVAPGKQMPFSLGIGRLPSEATAVESRVQITGLSDFGAERVGNAVFTGELVDVSFDEGSELVVHADAEVENVGTVGWRPDFALAVYAADGRLVGGGWAAARAEVLCPGEVAVVTGELAITPPPDFDPASADVRVHMFDFELAEAVTPDC